MNTAAYFLNLQIHPPPTPTHCLSQGPSLTAVASLFPLCVLGIKSSVNVCLSECMWKRLNNIEKNDILYKANFVWNTIDCIRVISWTSINNIKICYFIRVFMSFYLSVLRKERSPSKLVYHSFNKILQFKFLHCFLSFWYHTNHIVYCLAKCLFASSRGYGAGGGGRSQFSEYFKNSFGSLCLI